MAEWLVIARREFLERVRTVWFIVVTVLGPLLMTGLLVVPAWLAMRTAGDKAVIEVVDRSGRNLFPGMVRHAQRQEAGFVLESVSPDTEEELLLRRIREEKIAGFLVVPADVLTGAEAEYRGENATNFRVTSLLTDVLNDAAVEVRAEDAGISRETLGRLSEPPIEVKVQHDTGRGDTSSAEASFVAGYATMFVLYMAILLYAVNVMRSVIQEKTNRVVEVVVSSVKPRDLMLGKVIGVGAVGLLQLGIWAGIALVLATFSREVLGLFGIAGGGSLEMPALGVVDVAVILAYFSLGYFFYAALYAAIGAMVNTEQEAQQLQSPIVILLIIPVMCVQLVANHPRGGATQFLTQFPFSSPVLMPMRYLLGGASWAEVGLSIAILLISIGLAVALAGRIYRVGILMYGKRPSLRELARWIRYS
jgi:ABC-2 type transport system permease protein